MPRTFSTTLLGVALVVSSATVATAQPPPQPAVAAAEELVPDDAAARITATNERLGIDTPWRHALERAIDPSDHECAPTEFVTWINELLAGTDQATLQAIESFAASLWPTYYSLLLDNDASDDYIGVDGEYTKEQRKRHRDSQRFWDVPTGDVLLLGMHGAYMADDDKMVPTVQVLFGVDAGTAQAIVDTVQSLIEGEPTIGYDHPLFTLNAFAFSAEGEEVIPGMGIIPDKIVMGEGIITALEDLGLGTNAPDFVHAHEFAHHVQFELGAFDSDLPAPEATRRTELMADGFAAYNLAHARGATFQAKRIVDAVRAAYDVGDCAFSNPGHHGTPNQREAAALWGSDLADGARPQGHVRTAADMLALFEAELPTLVAPDA